MKKKIVLIIVSVSLVLVIAISIFSHIPQIRSAFLVKAIKIDDYKKIEKMLDSGVDPNIRTTSVITEFMLNFAETGGERPLAVACRVGNLKIVKLLIKYGATAEPHDTDRRSPLNETLLHYQPDDKAMVELLLKNGADINELDAYNTLPIFYAAEMVPKKYYGKKNGIVQYGKDYNEEVAQGITDIVIFLLENGNYDVNIKSEYNDSTLLITATKHGNKCLVEYLLSKCCDTTIKDSANKTALDYAKEYKRNEIIKLLKDYKSIQSNQKNLYLTENGDENSIIIKLPDNEFNAKTNKFIEDYIASTIYEITGKEFDLIGASVAPETKKPQDVEYYIEIESNATYLSDDTISIAFSGNFNKKGTAHPTSLFFTLNLDPNTMKKIDIADRYIIDSTLYNNFAQQALKQLTEELGDNSPNNLESFSKQICSESTFINGLKPDAKAPIYWHYAKSGIIFSYSVPYALGDHKEVEVSFDILKLK